METGKSDYPLQRKILKLFYRLVALVRLYARAMNINNLQRLFIDHLLPKYLPKFLREYLYTFLEQYYIYLRFRKTLVILDGWRGDDFPISMYPDDWCLLFKKEHWKRYGSGYDWVVPGFSNDWKNLPLLNHTHRLHKNTTHGHYHDFPFIYPAYIPLEFNQINLDRKFKNCAFKSAAKRKQPIE
jgi:hypothetical protein